MSEQLKRAAELLRREAKILRESNPDTPERRGLGGEWNGNLDAKKDHDDLLDAAEIVDKAIERLDSQSQTVVEAAERLAEQQARIAELEKSVEWWQGCTKDCGDVINDGIESRQQLRAKVTELEAQAAIGRRAVEMLREIAAEADDPLCHIGQRVSAILREYSGVIDK